MEYDQNIFFEKKIENINEIVLLRDNWRVSWFVVDGVPHIQLMEKLKNLFKIHQLMMENIIYTTQKPKAEEYPEHLFMY